jgi:hypothetical protein
MKRNTSIAALLFVLVLGSVTAGATEYHAQPISKSAAGRQYLRLFAPTGTAMAKFAKEVANWTSSTTDTQFEADAEPSISALENLNKGLIKDRWPAGAKTAATAVVSADKPLLRDLRSLSTLNFSTASSFGAALVRDDIGFGTAAATLQRDLGLNTARG